MARIQPLSGFPEWLPAQELLQRRILRHLEQLFELHGFQPLSTRAVEPIEVLTSKGGDTDKEIYALRRLHADPDAGEAALGLHFDLTVPFARYVAERRGELVFPWKRYQVQKVWRGERPQQGRYREFLQCDLDVIGSDHLPLRYDAEVIRLLDRALASLPIPPVTLWLNHRKLLEGIYRALGVEAIVEVLRAVDKRSRIGDRGVAEQLRALGLAPRAIEGILGAAAIEARTPEALRQAVEALGLAHPLLDQGLDELCTVLSACAGDGGRVRAALHIARGLDYYTGIVVEGTLEGHEGAGSVCSGGRYDDLAGEMAGGRLPGVGLSIGITRLLGLLYGSGELVPLRRSPCQVLVLLPSEERRAESEAVAEALRARGIGAEVFHRKAGWGKQFKRADQLGIRYAWFPGGPDGPDQVKDLHTGVQGPADRDRWVPEEPTHSLPLELRGERRDWP